MNIYANARKEIKMVAITDVLPRSRAARSGIKSGDVLISINGRANNISPMDLINIRRVAWGMEQLPRQEVSVNSELVELLTAKILERLG